MQGKIDKILGRFLWRFFEKRLDESLSKTLWEKLSTGKISIDIDLSKISVSSSGNIQPRG